MLKFFRKNARGWFMLIFMAIIIFVFVLYFGTDRGSRAASAVAIVDGAAIGEAEFYNEHSKMMDAVKARYGGTITADALKQMDLKQMALDNLINRQIIIAKAKDLKIQVSDDELRQTVMSIPALQTDGQFDNYKYKQLLRFNRMSAEDFEAGQKINLAAGKIETIIREGIKVSDQEVMDLYALQNQKINLGFVQLSSGEMKVATPSVSDLESHLKKNANEFRIPELVKIQYLYFAASNYAPSEISPEDIQDYYSRRKDSYKNKEGKPMGLDEVKTSIIRDLKQGKGMQNAYNEAKKAHDTIYQENNFAAYAAKNDLKIEAVDFFGLNKPPQTLSSLKDLAPQLANLQKNDITKVIPADNGYYLIRIEDKKSAYVPQLKDIENDVRQSFMKSEREKLVVQEAEAMIAKLQKGASLEQIAAEKGLKIQETGLFQPGAAIPKLGSHPEAMDILMSLSLNHPYASKPLSINNTQVVFKLKEQSPLDMKDFEIKKEVYRKVSMNLKREEAMKSWLEGNKAAMIKDKRLKINKEAKDL
jgi:peptidyl-prolyl cis-trans isomerase D